MNLFNQTSDKRFAKQLGKAGNFDESKIKRDEKGRFSNTGAAALGATAALGAVGLARVARPSINNFMNLYRGIRILNTRSGGPRVLARTVGERYPSVLEQTIRETLTGSKLQNKLIRSLGSSSARVSGTRNKYRDLYHGLRATGGGRVSSVFGAARRGTRNNTPVQNILLRTLGRPAGAVERTRDLYTGLRTVGSRNAFIESLARQSGMSGGTLRRLGIAPKKNTGLSAATENKYLGRLGWALRRIRRND